MTTFDPILVGHDGTDEARLAFSWAGSLAGALDAELVVAHAHSVGEFVGGPDSAAASSAAILAQWVSDDLTEVTPERVSPVVLSERPGPALVQAAKMHHAGLVVLGAHERPLRSSALGQVAQQVTFQSPCPVARVRSVGGPVSSSPLVVGFSGENGNEEVFRWAQELAGHLAVRLDAVTVAANRALLLVAEPLPANDVSAEDAPTADVEVHRLIGEPWTELLRTARDVNASAIVIGQRRRHNLGGRLLGRTAAWLLRKSDRPVIVLNHDS